MQKNYTMDSDSGGDEIGGKNNSIQRILKTKRSASVGSISQAEIRKIIGINKLPSTQATPLNKCDKKDVICDNKTNEKSVGETYDNNSINISKSQQESFSTENVNLAPDQVCKPRKSVQGTPPMATSSQKQSRNDITDADVFGQKSDITDGKSLYLSHIGSQKRQRSDSSPESNETKRKPNYQHIQNNEKNTKSNYVAQSTEDILIAVLDSLQIVQEFTTSNIPNESKNVQTALFTIHKHVTTLAFRIGQTEKNNLELRNQIRELTLGVGTALHLQSPSPSMSPTPQSTVKPDKPSFSDMLKFVPARNNPGSPASITEWKTPPQSKTKHETIVKIKGQTDPKVVLQEVKNSIKTSDVPGTFKRVKQLPTGSIIIECQNASQQEKLKTSLASFDKNIEIKTISNTDPMIMVTGILKGYTPEFFIKEFVNENPDMTVTFGSDVANHFKFITKRDCKNKTKENWIFQTPPDTFKWLIRNNNLTFDLCPAYVQEYTNVALCFKCCLFGHVAKYCTSNECCHKCGEAHRYTKCEVTT